MPVSPGTLYVPVLPETRAFTSTLGAELGPASAAIGKQMSASVSQGVASAKAPLVQSARTTGLSMGTALKAGLALGAVKLLGDAMGEFEESQKVAAQTGAVIESTGGAAGLTADEFEGLASAISAKTAIDDEQIQSAENMLATFTNVRDEVGAGNDIFSQATGVITDMSVAMGSDMKGSAILVGKALNDPLKGLTALTRVGVTFTEQQKAQIRVMVQAGDVMGAQRVILAELTKEFGGSAEAQVTASDRVRLAVGNVEEAIGGVLAPAIKAGAGLVTTLADGFLALPAPMQAVALGLVAVGVAGKPVMKIVGGLITNWKSMVKTTVGVIAKIAALGTAHVAQAVSAGGAAVAEGQLALFEAGAGVAAAGATPSILAMAGATGVLAAIAAELAAAAYLVKIAMDIREIDDAAEATDNRAAALTFSMDAIGKSADGIREAWRRAKDEFEVDNLDLAAATMEVLNRQVADGMITQAEYNDMVAALTHGLDAEIVPAIESSVAQFEEQQRVLESTRATMSEVREGWRGAAADIEELNVMTGGSVDGFGDLTEAAREARQAVAEGAENSQEKVGAFVDEGKAKIAELREAWSDWHDEIAESLGTSADAISQWLAGLEESEAVTFGGAVGALRDHRAEMRLWGREIRDVASVGDDANQFIQDFLANAQDPRWQELLNRMAGWNERRQEAFVDEYNRTNTLGGQIADSIQKTLGPALREMTDAVKEGVNAIVAELGGVPPFDIDTGPAKDALDDLETRLLGVTQRQWNVSMLVTYGTGPLAPPPPEDEKGARGWHGLVTRPTRFLAGEAGPERVDIWPRGSDGASLPSVAAVPSGPGRGRIEGRLRIEDWSRGLASLEAEQDWHDWASR